MDLTFLVVVVIVAALLFDFTNGFHDTANAMATSIATGALRPKVAVAIAAVLNLAGAFVTTAVAKTIAGGLVDEFRVTPAIVLGGLVGAILWNLFTWLLGLPSSSSHALFGGLIGAVWAAAGTGAVHFDAVLRKIAVPAVTSPVIAAVAAGTLTWLVYRLIRRMRRSKVERGFRLGQTVSAAFVSFAHGTGDAQKTMGVITLVLISAGALPAGSGPPVWVIAAAGIALAAGTYAGGWRIIRTMGRGLTDLESPQGFAAEASSATVILTASHLGLPLSTTQVCAGGIMGAGFARGRFAGVRWSVARRMAYAWLLTLPCAGVIGALAALLAASGNLGVSLVIIGALAAIGTMYWISRRDPVTAANVNGEPVGSEPEVAPQPAAPMTATAKVPVAA